MRLRHRFSSLLRAASKVSHGLLDSGGYSQRATFNAIVVEPLESRKLLDAITPPFDPSQVRTAFGLNSSDVQTTTNGIQGTGGFNGAGETIAIIVFLSDTGLLGQANAFSQAYHLPPFTAQPQAGSPTLSILNSSGKPNPLLGAAAVGSTQDAEAATDVEWAHVIAPMANIDVLECGSNFLGGNSASDADLALKTARTLTGVTVVSMSIAPATAF